MSTPPEIPMIRVIRFLTKELGHEPSGQELLEHLNGMGLIRIVEKLKLEDQGELQATRTQTRRL